MPMQAARMTSQISSVRTRERSCCGAFQTAWSRGRRARAGAGAGVRARGAVLLDGGGAMGTGPIGYCTALMERHASGINRR